MGEDSQPQSNQLTLNGIIFIGAILVVANTELDYWKEINYQVYYYFIDIVSDTSHFGIRIISAPFKPWIVEVAMT